MVERHAGPIAALVFSPTGDKLASSAKRDTQTRVFDRHGNLLATQDNPSHSDALAFSAHAEYPLAVGADRMIRLWGIESQSPGDSTVNAPLVLRQHTEPVTALAVSPDGRTLASTSQDMSIRLWQLDNPFSTTLVGHRGTVWEVDVNADGTRIASGGDDGTVRLWDIDGSPLATLDGFEDIVRTVRFSPDGRLLAAGSHDGSVRLFEVRDGTHPRQVAQFLADRIGVNEVSFSPDGRTLVTSGLSGTLGFWNAIGEKIGHPAEKPAPPPKGVGPKQIWGARFGSHGELIWMGAKPPVYLRLSEQTKILKLNGHHSGIVRADFSPDGSLIATAEVTGSAILWDREGRQIRRFSKKSTGLANSVDFSPDGRWFAVAGLDGTVRIWRVEDGVLLRTLRGHESAVTFAVFGKDNRTLVTCSTDGTVRIWRRLDLDFKDLMAATADWLKNYPRFAEEHWDAP